MSSEKVILCVDNDPNALMTRRILLSTRGYEVLIALSGSAALRVLAVEHVDLLITDDCMPDMTGTELVAAVKSRDEKVRSLILAGGHEPLAGSEPADMVLIKGGDPKVFLTTVAQLLEQLGSSAEGDTSGHEPE